MPLPNVVAERMDEFSEEEATESLDARAPSPRWAGAQFIGLAQHLNEQCIELICQLAVDPSFPELPPCVSENRDLWRLLEAEERKRVAALPFVILDVRFKDIDWWQGWPHRPLKTSTPATLLSDLLLDTLLFARQAAREDVSVAKAMFAMTSPVASVIASLNLQQVRSVASSSAAELRLRWDNNSIFWRDLLTACRSNDSEQTAALRRQAKLLFCGFVIPNSQIGNKPAI